MYRFFTPNKLVLGGQVALDREEMHHLKKVLRVREGEIIELVDGNGTLATALYEETITPLSLDCVPKPEKRPVLIQALPEKGHLEWILEKGTELGIFAFHLFPAERSKFKEFSDNAIERMEKILVSTLKQSKRLFLPTLQLHTQFPKLDIPLFLADPKGAPFTPVAHSAAFIVGPESGFTHKEVEQFKKIATPVSLSPNILRVETAAMISSFLLAQ